MAEQTGATGAQAAPETQPPAGDSGAQAAPEGGEPSPQPESISLEEARKLRSEANSLRKRLKEYEDADKSESEKAAQRLKDLEEALASERTRGQTLALQMSTFNVARKLGFRNPEIAYRLLGSEVEFAEDGSPKNVESLLKAIAQAEPYLVNSTTDYGGGPRGQSPNSGADMNALIRRKAGRAA
jgi:hypothetical protein